MTSYILRRLLLVLPTLLGIITINFFVVQLAPGGPVEQFLAKLEGTGDVYMERLGGETTEVRTAAADDAQIDSPYTGGRGLPPEVIKAVKEMYGFDRPLHERYLTMLTDFLRFDFGDSLFKGRSVIGLLGDALPVSISLGLWSTLLIYMISIPLGIAKAVRQGSRFDMASGFMIVAGHAIPSFLFAVMLITFFAGGRYFQWFPLRGLVSPDFENLSSIGRALDYAHHMALPIIAMVIGGFAGLTMLTRNAFLDEIGKQYVETARSKGLTEKQVLWGHVFRNAMLIVISGFPAAFIGLFFAGSLLIESIFSLNGIGLLGFEAAIQRDYPVMFATLFIFTLIGLVTSILGDVTAMLVDPRLDFESREVRSE